MHVEQVAGKLHPFLWFLLQMVITGTQHRVKILHLEGRSATCAPLHRPWLLVQRRSLWIWSPQPLRLQSCCSSALCPLAHQHPPVLLPIPLVPELHLSVCWLPVEESHNQGRKPANLVCTSILNVWHVDGGQLMSWCTHLYRGLDCSRDGPIKLLSQQDFFYCLLHNRLDLLHILFVTILYYFFNMPLEPEAGTASDCIAKWTCMSLSSVTRTYLRISTSGFL